MSPSVIKWVLKPAAFAAGLGPLGWIIWAGLTGNLSANPLSDITNETGIWALRFICITLALTPIRRVTGWNAIIKFRRMTGLYAFFYGSLHFLTWFVLDQFFDLDAMVHDIAKRPFITIGFLAFVLLIPLAVTSTAGWIRRLGGRRWQVLHRLVYVSAVCGVMHYYWLVKADVSRPLRYGVVVAVLLGARIAWQWARSPQKGLCAPAER